MTTARLIVTTAAATLLLAACSSSPSPSASTSTPSTSPSTSASSASASATTETPTPSTSSASPTSASPSGTPGVTAVTVRLTGQALCVGGLLGMHNTTISPVWEKGSRIPASGVVTLSVPSKYTRHLAFDVNCTRWPNIDAVPIVALQFQGVAAGQSPSTASNGKPKATTGAYCWAGTSATAATLTVKGWIDAGDGTPLSGTIDLWADPMLSTVASVQNGTHWDSLPLGHQDEPYC
jgi:hypothetical protein